MGQPLGSGAVEWYERFNGARACASDELGDGQSQPTALAAIPMDIQPALFSLPIIAKKSELQQHSGSFPQKTESHFWTVERMTDFENVGFCNTVEGIKYLICADCEIGPLGYHDTHSAAGGQPLFHIAVSRVRTRDTDPLPG
ncbi:Guanine nucleotide exchange factor MSS4 [Echinococcus granulosus]|uniref:Guanine nucleotide exchange factor MSS4 n=1 Tax=Echinococcus granulosus TaxID=6210 RepID=W6UPJ4_ECHGR|nr:Guanine nucleotide exchange factor MSS4 [Echinococcus granulosus]EUB63178.1 Guanine nucleotide exchange factor MSS4 [Echinococcus granulosus]